MLISYKKRITNNIITIIINIFIIVYLFKKHMHSLNNNINTKTDNITFFLFFSFLTANISKKIKLQTISIIKIVMSVIYSNI